MYVKNPALHDIIDKLSSDKGTSGIKVNGAIWSYCFQRLPYNQGKYYAVHGRMPYEPHIFD